MFTAYVQVAGLETFSGLMPALVSFQAYAEAPTGTYPFTRTLLGLLAGLLERGFTDGCMPAYVMHVLNELLPSHSAWSYGKAEERWQVSAAVLRIIRAAACAGAAAPGTEMPGAAGDPDDSKVAASSTRRAELAEQLLSEAACTQVVISPLGAAVLRLLLLHGGSLLGRALPPRVAVLDELRGVDALGPVLPAMEACVVEVGTGMYMQIRGLTMCAASAHHCVWLQILSQGYTWCFGDC